MTRATKTLDQSPAATFAKPAVEMFLTPTDEQIARRAYEIYQARGANDGADLDDWLQAERELSEPAK
jgi:hypothetical protein